MTEINLRNIPLFSTLMPDDIENLTKVFRPVTLDTGEILFHEGDPGDKFYLITAGQVEIVKTLDTAEAQVLAMLSAGEVLGEMSVLHPDGLRTASVRATTSVKMMVLSRGDFEKLLQDYPALGIEMVRVLSRRLRSSEDVMVRDLIDKNEELARAYQELQAAQAQLVQKEKLEHELELARSIQRSILPDNLALMDGFDFGARMLPARAVGGDLYDFIQLDEDSIGISIGDVSDKGVHAAMFMALYCSFLRAEAPHAATPADTLARVNRHLADVNDTNMFVTAIYGILDRKTGEFSYARAGHQIPALVDANGVNIPVMQADGQLLGIFPKPIVDVQTVVLAPGSTLMLYTDGMCDVFNEREELFGEDRLLQMLSVHQNKSAQGLCDTIVAELQKYQGTHDQFDDMTVVAIKAL
jgi:sigma-B regulation protein RsbU (phosphoserine phosphatase)